MANNQIQVLESNENCLSVINKIVKSYRQEEAFCICDVSEIVRNDTNWKEVFSDINIFYGVRCNSTRIVLEVQAALENGFSCVSREEIRMVLSLGVSPKKILFANPTKKISHLVYAADAGVDLITFDNEEELNKIKNYHPSARLLLRVDFKEPCETDITSKFGIQSEGELKRILLTAKALKLNVIGIYFFKEGRKDIKHCPEAIELIHRYCNIGCKLGFNLKLLVIAGLFEEKIDSVEKVSKTINESLKLYFPNGNIKIVAEVGRYCVESAFKTVSYIHSKRTLEDGTRMYYLDVGVYNALSPIIFQNYFEATPLKNHSNSPLFPSILWGPTCDSTDKITEDVEYLPKMEIGDWLIFNDTGAYTFPITYEFNGYSLPNIHSIVKKEEWSLLTEYVTNPMPKSKFLQGESENNYTSGLKVPYIYDQQY